MEKLTIKTENVYAEDLSNPESHIYTDPLQTPYSEQSFCENVLKEERSSDYVSKPCPNPLSGYEVNILNFINLIKGSSSSHLA